MPNEGRATDLYRRHGPAIYARCRRLLGDDAAAEDATQETFLRVYKNLEKAPDDAAAKLWVYRIATNHCLDLLRSRAKWGKGPEPDNVAPLSAGRSVEDLMADRDLAQRIIMHSPAKVRAAAFLHYLDGLDQGEVAKMLGVSRRTVGSWLAQFLLRARAFVNEEQP
jgi:RNA polymerase sigma-70 factor (ECF subfamily)